MRDIDVRVALRRSLTELHQHEQSTLVVEELGLCEKSSRIDIAVVNGSLNGFEIKSARDTLERLPFQAKIYSRVFDTVCIVADEGHLQSIDALVPPWWGLTAAVMIDGGVCLESVRETALNPAVDPFSLAQLLWRDEVLSELERLGIADGVRSRPREILWRRLADSIPLPALSTFVRETLKTRQCWRVTE